MAEGRKAERLEDRQEMMEKLDASLGAVKKAADHELTKQKHSYEEKLRDLERMILNTELRRSEDHKVEEAEQLKRAGVSFKVDNKLPNLVNLNEDPQWSEMLLYVLKKGKTTVGRNIGCDIQLAGIPVARNHCTIENNDGDVILYPSTNEEAQTFVNGTLQSTSTELHHGDRLVIAGEHFFRFNHPLQVEQGAGRKSTRGRNFEYARDEFIKAQTERLEAERLKDRQEMMEKLDAVKKAADHKLTKLKHSYEEKLRDLEGTLVGKNIEVSEQLQQQESEAEERIQELERQKRELEEETIAQRKIIELERQKTQQEYQEMEEQSSRLMKELEQERLKLEMDVEGLLQKNQENRQRHVNNNDNSASSMDLIRGSELLRIATMIQEANVISKNLMKPFNFTREDMFENDEISIMVKVTNMKKKKVTFWNPEKFEARLEQMRELYQHSSGSVTSLDQEGLSGEEWSPLMGGGDSDPFHDPDEEWVQDSLLSSYSPLSVVDGGQSSVLSIFTPPGSGLNRTPRSSVSESPKRALLASVSSTPVLSYAGLGLTPHSSPTKQVAQAVAQICYDKMGPILTYQHTTNPSIFSNILTKIKKLKSVIQELSDSSKGEFAMDVFLSLQLMFDSACSLETFLSMLKGADEEILSKVRCRSIKSVRHMVSDISRQTCLYSSRLIQALLSDSIEDCKNSVVNIDESLDGVVSSIGQISLCLRVEEIVCERDRQTSTPLLQPPDEEDEHLASLFQYGYQTWCSCLLSELLRSLHFLLDQFQSFNNEDALYTLREILEHVSQLLYQISEVQELFWLMVDRDTLGHVVSVLSKVWRTYTSIDTMCSLFFQRPNASPPSIDQLISINQQVSLWSEQTATCLITFLSQRSTNEVVSEVQAIARDVAMTTRLFTQQLKQRSIAFPLEGLLLTTPQKSVDENAVLLPTDFFLPSPSPLHSDTDSSQDTVDNDSSQDISDTNCRYTLLASVSSTQESTLDFVQPAKPSLPLLMKSFSSGATAQELRKETHNDQLQLCEKLESGKNQLLLSLRTLESQLEEERQRSNQLYKDKTYLEKEMKELAVRFSVGDLYNVLIAVADLQPQWEELGLSLGLSEEDLYRISKAEHCSVCRCLYEVLRYWIMRIGGSWEKLVVALKSDQVDRNDVAQKITEEYITGDRGNCCQRNFIVVKECETCLDLVTDTDDLIKVFQSAIDWKVLGLLLGLADDTLEKIQTECSSLEQCQESVIKHWISSGHSYWSTLVEALKGPVLGETQLANTLSEKHLGMTVTLNTPDPDDLVVDDYHITEIHSQIRHVLNNFARRFNSQPKGIIYIFGISGAAGTEVDVDNIERIFKTELKFANFRRDNLTCSHLATHIKAAATFDYPMFCKHKGFYFAGHGGIDQNQQPYFNAVSENDECIFVQENILKFFKGRYHKPSDSFMFFFDCCLSSVQTTMNDRKPFAFEIPVRCLVAFATSPGLASIGNSEEGGRWTNLFCQELKKLQKGETLTSVLDRTHKAVMDHSENLQPPQYTSCVGPIYLKGPPASGIEKSLKSFTQCRKDLISCFSSDDDILVSLASVFCTDNIIDKNVRANIRQKKGKKGATELVNNLEQAIRVRPEVLPKILDKMDEEEILQTLVMKMRGSKEGNEDEVVTDLYKVLDQSRKKAQQFENENKQLEEKLQQFQKESKKREEELKKEMKMKGSNEGNEDEVVTDLYKVLDQSKKKAQQFENENKKLEEKLQQFQKESKKREEELKKEMKMKGSNEGNEDEVVTDLYKVLDQSKKKAQQFENENKKLKEQIQEESKKREEELEKKKMEVISKMQMFCSQLQRQ